MPESTADGNDQSCIYVWFDTEFSSLTLESALLLQVSAVITDHTLQRRLPASEDFNAIVRLPDDVTCDPWVNQNLPDLVQRCRSEEARSVDTVDEALVAYINAAAGDSVPAQKAERPLLAGNTLQCDWFLARRYLPLTMDRVNYRSIDVSSWKVHLKNCIGEIPFDKNDRALIRKYFPGEYNSDRNEHDAHFDVLASIAEFNYYTCRQKWVPEEPG